MARFGVVIVNYNSPKFLEPQIIRLRKYLKLNDGDTLDIIVADNSRRGSAIKLNKQTCEKLGAIYIKFHFDEGDYSSHHALALNEIVKQYRDNFNSLLLIDHDIFLFDYSDILLRAGDRRFIGLAQNKIGRTYLHPGLLLINLDAVQNIEFNFLPCDGMDTGGQMCDVVEKSKVEYLNVFYTEYETEGLKDFYEVIDNTWMHFVKGSNWNKNKNHSIRIEYLTNELERISK